jgi:hypothetical protein
MRRTFRVALGASALLFCTAGSASAQHASAQHASAQHAALDAARAVLVVDAPASGEDTLLPVLADAAVSALTRAFAAHGVAVAMAGAEAPSGAASPVGTDATAPAAVEAARRSGARWGALIRARIQNRRFLWRISVYDANDSTLRAADSFSAFAGLGALPLLETSSEVVVDDWWSVKDAAPPELPIRYALRFESSGGVGPVEVRFGSKTVIMRAAGVVGEEPLEAAYAPFKAGESIAVELSAPDAWPRTIELKKGPTEKTIVLPPLVRRADGAGSASLEMGRLPGFVLGYRWYPVEDRLFAYAENALWASVGTEKGSRAVLHDELRGGLALYLNPLPDTPFRFTLGAGISGIATFLTEAPGFEAPLGFDLCLEPVRFGFEFHWPEWAIVVTQRMTYSVGLDSGFLHQGWSEFANGFPVFVSVGVLFKW